MKLQKNDYPLLYAEKDFSDRIRLGFENARKAAAFLKKKYAVKKILLFGSLLNPDLFHSESDIDLAVDGIPDRYFYQAAGELMDIVQGFSIDVVDLNDCKPELRERIVHEGVEL